MSNRKHKPTRAEAAGTGMFRWAGVLGILIAAVFFPSLKIPFLLDDYQIYLDYWPSVSGKAFWHDVTQHFQQNRFLTHVTWYLQLLLQSPGRPDPGGFHIVNMVLHWINAVLVLYLVRGFGASAPAAALTAALFAVHPTQMEAVSYIYGRSDLLVTAFLLGALMALRTGSAPLRVGGGQGCPVPNAPVSEISRTEISPLRVGGALVLAVLAVMTKETAVVLPALYLLVSAVLRPAFARFSKVAFAVSVLSAAASVAGFLFLKTDHADNFGFHVPNAARYLLLQPFCLFIGLARAVFPTGFSIVYQFDLPGGVLDFVVIGPVLFWTILTGACVRQYRRGQRIYLFALGWYLAALSPTNSVVPRIDQISDRHLYMALIGPFWAMTTLIESAWSRYGNWIQKAAWTGVVVLGGLTFARNVTWQSPIAVWQETIHAFPKSHLAYRELAGEYGRAGNIKLQIQYLQDATRIAPLDWTSWNNLGIAYGSVDRRAEERQAYQQALRTVPGRHRAGIHHNLGYSYQNTKQFSEAIEAYRLALKEDPHYVNSKHNLAVLLWMTGNAVEAETLLADVVARHPHMDLARQNLERVRRSRK
ncbi:tetratricopeptide repeat protein [bacterium]|nr:tetratricopeptide repeat protein [bacterium]